MSRDGIIKMWDLRNGVIIQVISLDNFSDINAPMSNSIITGGVDTN